MVAKSKPTTTRSVNRSPTLDSGASYSPGNYKIQIIQKVKDVNENAAPCSQVLHQNEKYSYQHREIDCENTKSTHSTQLQT